MKDQPANLGIRPGVLAVVSAAVAVALILVWTASKRHSQNRTSSPSAEALNVSTLETAAPAEPPSAKTRTHFTAAAVHSELPSLPAPTRLSPSGTGAETADLGMIMTPAGFQGQRTFDYRAQAAQAAEAARLVMAETEQRSQVPVALGQIPPAPGQALSQSQLGPVGLLAGVATSPGAASLARLNGTITPSPVYQSPAPSDAQPNAGVDLANPPSAEPPLGVNAGTGTTANPAAVTPGSGAPGNRTVNNAVDAFREEERVRRAYVEEMRKQRVNTILELRQKSGN